MRQKPLALQDIHRSADKFGLSIPRVFLKQLSPFNLQSLLLYSGLNRVQLGTCPKKTPSGKYQALPSPSYFAITENIVRS